MIVLLVKMLSRSSLHLLRGCAMQSDLRRPRGARSEAPGQRSGALGSGGGCPVRVVAFATDHQLPGDARRLVGQRHRGQLLRLAVDRPASQGECLAGLLLTCLITAMAPTTSVRRRASSPARVITPRRCLPAVE
jgi:hypothetical protein